MMLMNIANFDFATLLQKVESGAIHALPGRGVGQSAGPQRRDRWPPKLAESQIENENTIGKITSCHHFVKPTGQC